MQKPILAPGLCECGCGERTMISERTQPSRGYVRGKPFRFIHGHGAHKGPAGFWRNVPDHLPPDVCWEWQGKRNEHGYGYHRDTIKTRAHREMFEWANGPIPDGLHILHRCDNPPCCNPAHLFAGTRSDNMRDMVAKGRAGWQRPDRPAPVPEDVAHAMRRLHATGDITHRQLARAFETTRYAVGLVMNRQIWPD